jgi:hypothetical protein
MGFARHLGEHRQSLAEARRLGHAFLQAVFQQFLS